MKEFDAKFCVVNKIELVSFDAHNDRLTRNSHWYWPEFGSPLVVEPGGTYFVAGLFPNSQGKPQDARYWVEAGEVGEMNRIIHSDELKALQEEGLITLLEGSFIGPS